MKRFDDELDFDDSMKAKISLGEYVKYGAMILGIVIAIFLLVIMLRPKQEETALGTQIDEQLVTEQIGSSERQDIIEETEIQGTDLVEVTEEISTEIELLTATTVAETSGLTQGIDVSKYQGVIDWALVAEENIDFAMVRVGLRSMKTGTIQEDEMARYNLQEASKHGIKLGIYFFSTAITEEEAIEEADWVAELISQYAITYPVAFDYEEFEEEGNRHYGLTKEERTDIADAFLNRIYEHGYTPMFYGAKNQLTDDLQWETSRLEKKYRVWVSQYSAVGRTDYSGQYVMWQCTNKGQVAGIEGDVDRNIAYFGYDGIEQPHSDTAPEQVTADVGVLMNFEVIDETVTAKNKTNLRNIPSQGEDSTVMTQLVNGDTARRTGISDSGWSRVEYNGMIYYAVSSYLTTDLQAPVQQDAPVDDDGIKTEFASCNDTVTAKIEVNLRTLPSVTHPDSQVIVTLKSGENVTRTGINQDYGWSRVEYNGQTLYCVSSYLKIVQ